MQTWLEETFHVENNGKNATELANEDIKLGRFPELYLLQTGNEIVPSGCGDRGSETREKRMSMMFRSRHDIIDGVGSMKLLNYLFDFAAEYFKAASKKQFLSFGDEVKRLSPPLHIAASIPESPTELQLARLDKLRVESARARENIELIMYPGPITSKAPGKSQQIGIKIPPRHSSELISKCKSFRVSATHVFHAAIAVTLRDLQARQDVARKASYISYALIDVRKFCGKSGEQDSHPASVLSCVSLNSLFVELTIPSASEDFSKMRNEDLISALHQVKAFYNSIVVDNDFLAVTPAVYESLTPAYPEQVLPIEEPSPLRAVSLSSLGVLDSLVQPRHGPFTIHDPWGIGAEYSTGMGLFLGTFDGEMKLWAGYNEAFHESEDVFSFLSAVKDVAFQILEAIESR